MSTVRNINMPWLALVRQVDEDYDRSRVHEHAYSFDSFGNHRAFFINPLTAGVYGDTRIFLLDESGNPVLDDYGFPILVDQQLLGTDSGQQIVMDGGRGIVVE